MSTAEPATTTTTFATLRRQAGVGLRLLLVFTVVCGVLYPLLIWGVSRIPGISGSAEGAVTATGSTRIGVDPVPADPANDPWFHTRPAAASEDVLGPTDTTASAGSNLGGFDEGLLETVEERRSLIAAREGVEPALVPVDAVTASGSGQDPHISPEYAALQAERVARVTGLPPADVERIVADASSGRVLGFLGEPVVDVQELNAAIAAAAPDAR